MNQRALFDKIDLSLIRVLHTVITESSVSRAAVKLRSNQPAVSAQLRRLRELTGDPLLVRSGRGMAPTDVALSLVEPAATILQQAQWIFGDKSAARGFDPATAEVTFRIAATDYLDPWFLPELTLRLRRLAPRPRLSSTWGAGGGASGSAWSRRTPPLPACPRRASAPGRSSSTWRLNTSRHCRFTPMAPASSSSTCRPRGWSATSSFATRISRRSRTWWPARCWC